jgi:hypothetical protein
MDTIENKDFEIKYNNQILRVSPRHTGDQLIFEIIWPDGLQKFLYMDVYGEKPLWRYIDDELNNEETAEIANLIEGKNRL